MASKWEVVIGPLVGIGIIIGAFAFGGVLVGIITLVVLGALAKFGENL